MVQEVLPLHRRLNNSNSRSNIGDQIDTVMLVWFEFNSEVFRCLQLTNLLQSNSSTKSSLWVGDGSVISAPSHKLMTAIAMKRTVIELILFILLVLLVELRELMAVDWKISLLYPKVMLSYSVYFFLSLHSSDKEATQSSANILLLRNSCVALNYFRKVCSQVLCIFSQYMSL